MNGLLLVDKPKGMTSHDVVNKIRKLTKTKKVGHTGTLDPNASGLLIICIGEATKLIPYLTESNKEYIGEISFGKSTTTDDSEGEILEEKSIEDLDLSQLELLLPEFQGEIEQIPPIYSAKKVNGKKLYNYARKNEEVEIKPSLVTINNLKILDDNCFPEKIDLFVDCSKGTYIRSLARDIGLKLNNLAHLSNLRRIKTNTFKIENSAMLEELSTADNIEDYLISINEMPLEFPRITINNNSKRIALNGGKLYQKNLNSDINTLNNGQIVVLILNNNILGIGTIKSDNEKKYVQPKKILNL